MKYLVSVSMALVLILMGCKKDKPATQAVLTTTAVTNVTASTVQTGGTITNDGGADIFMRGICWAAHSNPTVGDSITSDGTGAGTFTSKSSGLIVHTTYYIKAYAINAAGTAYGNELSFTTANGAPAVITAAITNSLPLVATSGGKVINDGGAPVTARGICYSTSPHPTITDFKTSDGAGTGFFIDSLKPLASLTIYYVRAYATNSYGTGYGNEISFTSSSANTVTDIDGNVYSCITIGSQTWMASNLKVEHYRNGDPITNGLTGFDWNANTPPPSGGGGMLGAYTFPNGDPANKAQFGLYYNMWAVVDNRNIAPAGWHVPTDGDWQILEYNQGMLASDTGRSNYRGAGIAPKFVEGGSSGLNLQLAGVLFTAPPVTYSGFGINGYYNSSTLNITVNGPQLWHRQFSSASPFNQYIRRTNANVYATSIRCVKD
jgi:uncharacterized protein (TIGR02145 family)